MTRVGLTWLVIAEESSLADRAPEEHVALTVDFWLLDGHAGVGQNWTLARHSCDES